MNEKKFNTLLSGLIPSLILPVLTIVGFWIAKSDQSFGVFLRQFQELHMLSKVISLAAVPNLLLFFVFIWTNRLLSARGVIFGTILLAFFMLLLKLI